MISYLDFKPKYLGQSMVGDNPVDAGECNGLIQVYFVMNGIGHIPGNAIDIYANAPDQYFEKLPPDTQVQQGDIFCCGKPWGWNPVTKTFNGHIGFVDQPMQGQSFMGLEANGTYNPPHKVQMVFHQSRPGFLGFLRLKEEYQMQIFDEQARVDWNLILFGHDEGLFHECVSMEFKSAMYKLKDLPAFKHEHYANKEDIGYYLNFFAGHAPSDSDVTSLGADPSTGSGTQPHKQVVYELMKRPDVIAHQNAAQGASPLAPGLYKVQ